ncbi:glycosyltransferase [Arthrobacter sp. SLBN-112]|uniref:glycosyltransferase n=1 Tax=Arthrobacter sp. SLBN-112 TaxID=2768452 RepID=UPI0028114CB8|nr:glycosyltransferase [Arthrobacter sp. SLBN-112]
MIVQPYVPEYRMSFFNRLIEELDSYGVRCRVAAASPHAEQSARGDAVQAPWIVEYSPREFKLMGKTIGLGGARRLWNEEDGVIVGLLGSSVDTTRAIIDGRRKGLKVGLWGHVKPYVNNGNSVDLAIEAWQLRNCNQVFAYTQGGRDYAISKGVDPRLVTTVMNATDTSRLVRARDSLSSDLVSDFMQAHNLRKHRTLGYVGGLDGSKRIDFLAETLDQLWITDPDIKIVIGGRGSEAHLLDTARSRGQVTMLGYASPEDQALIGRISSAIVMPGRIGLVAVDALVLQLPILTTRWPYHAPEYEYLVESSTCFSSADNVLSYANLIRSFLDLEARSNRQPNITDWEFPTIDKMVDNFSIGTLKMLDII